MSKSTKKLISQRWDVEFSDKMKKIASKLNITTTDLTIESLHFIAKLVENQPNEMKDPKKRKELLQSFLDNDSPIRTTSSNIMKNKSTRAHSGYVKDRLSKYLKDNEGQLFSSIELSEKLDIPQPTVRTYIRKLAEIDSKFKIISGRPNFVGYNAIID